MRCRPFSGRFLYCLTIGQPDWIWNLARTLHLSPGCVAAFCPMWLKRSSGAQLGDDKRYIPAFDTVLFHSSLSSLRRKFLGDVPTDKIVLSYGPEISKRPLKIRCWWLKNKARKCHFRFVERGFLAAFNCTGSAEGALVPVLLRITHWPKSGLPVSPPGLFPPCTNP